MILLFSSQFIVLNLFEINNNDKPDEIFRNRRT